MNAELLITVVGIPAPQGSKSYKGMRAGKPILVESSKKVRPWREVVVIEARSAIVAAGGVALDGPIEMTVVFYLPPPKTMPKGRTAPTTYPDLSKLVRSTEDALVTAGVIVDDARIVRTVSEKQYTVGSPGAVIWIRPAKPSERHAERRTAPLAGTRVGQDAHGASEGREEVAG